MLTFKKPKRYVNKVFVHCSASDYPQHDDVSVMRAWHMQKGWRDVGYHFFIKKDGTIQQGRDLELIPSAQANYNAGSIAICMHGLLKEKFTEAQYNSLRGLCKQINSAYGKMITFHGHCEVSTKACPVYDYKSILKLDKSGKLGI